MTNEYNGDYYGWLTATAQAVLEGRDFDRAQVAEELADMGKSERLRIESHLGVILTHMLKIRYQPDRHSRSWDLSIAASRMRARKLFNENPSLAARVGDLMADAYDDARFEAANDTGLPLDTFPADCPFSLEEVLGPTD